MDAPTAQLGLTVAGLIATFFTKAVEEAGKSATDAGVTYLSQLAQLVRRKLSHNASASTALETLEKLPEDQAAETAVANYVDQWASKDTAFREELIRLSQLIAQAPTQVSFRNDIRGNLDKLVQIQINYGPITFS